VEDLDAIGISWSTSRSTRPRKHGLPLANPAHGLLFTGKLVPPDFPDSDNFFYIFFLQPRRAGSHSRGFPLHTNRPEIDRQILEGASQAANPDQPRRQSIEDSINSLVKEGAVGHPSFHDRFFRPHEAQTCAGLTHLPRAPSGCDFADVWLDTGTSGTARAGGY